MINKDTQLCISLASRPSNFGTTLHNAAYAALNLNYVYKAFGISDIVGAIAGVRALGIRGCSISMPFKETVIPLLDTLDNTAEIVCAVNTIVNDHGRVTGYNTDVIGARVALQSIQVQPDESVLLLGAGGVAKAIAFALSQLGVEKVRVANRDIEKAQSLNAIIPCQPVAWADRQRLPASLIINATCVGMAPETELMPVDKGFIRQARAVMDVVISPMETRLIQFARSESKAFAPGCLMSLEQAVAQFKLYTGKEAPRDVMEQCMSQLLLQ